MSRNLYKHPFTLAKLTVRLMAMSKKSLLALSFILVLLVPILAGVQLVNVAKANPIILPSLAPPIYIRSDGSIDPSTAPIQQSGNVYMLTDNVFNCTIEIQKDNIILDGAGFTLTQAPLNMSGYSEGPVGWYPAVGLNGVSNVTVKNLIIANCSSGIDFSDLTSSIGSFNTTVINNKITGCGYAIFSSGSSNSTIAENELTGNGNGIVVSGSSYLNISGNNITQGDEGVEDLGDSPNALIYANNIINNTEDSISVNGPQDNITENTINNNGEGVVLGFHGNSDITKNIIMNNGNFGDSAGIYLLTSNDSTVSGNFVSNNSLGIELSGSNQNIITENMVTDNNGWGIELLGNYGSANNTIYHNNFANNKTQGFKCQFLYSGFLELGPLSGFLGLVTFGMMAP